VFIRLQLLEEGLSQPANQLQSQQTGNIRCGSGFYPKSIDGESIEELQEPPRNVIVAEFHRLAITKNASVFSLARFAGSGDNSTLAMSLHPIAGEASSRLHG
jgi:hypothetical protein